MPVVLLVRHGRTTANATGVLAGRTPGVGLDEVGRDQVERAGERMQDVPLVRVVTSPLQRCQETSAALLAHQQSPVTLVEEPAVLEADYGDWQGRKLAELAKEDLWTLVQRHPSRVVFPGGESMRTMQNRAVDAVRAIDAAVAAEHGDRAVWALVSHGDILKAILADALGQHLDLFQRLAVNPASVSVVGYGEDRPSVLAMNTTAGDLAWVAGPAPTASAGAVGGGDSPDAPSPDRA